MAERILNDEERQKSVNILAALYDVSETPTTRRILVENAGLHRFVAGLTFTGNQRTFAGQLVSVAERFGMLPEKPNSHALGALLSYVLSLGELPSGDAAYLATLIVKYTLVTDGDYLADLKKTYSLSIEPVPSPETPATVSLRNVSAADEPGFAPPQANQEALEKIITSEDNFLDIYLLAGAMYSAQAVGRIERPSGTAQGTGFLIGPDLVLTNQHVIRKQEHLEDAVIRFGYQVDARGLAEAGRAYRFDTAFYKSSPPDQLDFALLRLTEEPLDDRRLDVQPGEGFPPFTELLKLGKHRGYLLIGARELTEGDRVNIIQHPYGWPQKVVLTQNYIVKDMTATRVHYLADTDKGSSGSPVFNRNWEVVALHHSGNPVPPLQMSEMAELKLRGNTQVNEGIPMRAILKEIERWLPR
jgi:V8-like Glu-specific endopeptidase